MKVQVTSIREKIGKYGNSLMFNLWFPEIEFLSCGWRLSKGAILSPSYQVGANYQSTFFIGAETQEAIYEAVGNIDSAQFSKIEPLLEFSDAVYSWAVNPEILRRKAPEALKPREVRPVPSSTQPLSSDSVVMPGYHDADGRFHYRVKS